MNRIETCESRVFLPVDACDDECRPLRCSLLESSGGGGGMGEGRERESIQRFVLLIKLSSTDVGVGIIPAAKNGLTQTSRKVLGPKINCGVDLVNCFL